METATSQGLDGQKRSSSKGSLKNGKANGGKRSVGSDGGGDSEHGIHIWTERERRKKMKNMFTGLHALLPHLPAKADKSTIVDEAIKYISTLQQSLKSLENRRLEKVHHHPTAPTILDFSSSDPILPEAIIGSTSQTPPVFESSREPSSDNLINFDISNNICPIPVCFQTWFSPNVVMSMCGYDAQISVCSTRKPGLLATVFYILEKHNLDVVSAHVSADRYRCIYLIHAHAVGGATNENFLETLSVEDKFKLAAGEMNLWISSC